MHAALPRPQAHRDGFPRAPRPHAVVDGQRDIARPDPLAHARPGIALTRIDESPHLKGETSMPADRPVPQARWPGLDSTSSTPDRDASHTRRNEENRRRL
jgi:hypothetical protein